MAISIAPNSARITNLVRPIQNQPSIDNTGTQAVFDSVAMSADGEITLNGLAGDSTIGWQIGWIQAQWIETNWYYYRGQFNNHGSLFIQRARPPARPQQSCRDTGGPVGDIFALIVAPEFVADPVGAFPLRVQVSTSDDPADSCDLIVNNTLTGQPNFLREAQLEFHFCTILSVRDPAGNFHHQASFYWNLRWQARFLPTSFPNPAANQWNISPVTGGNGGAISHVIPGRPTDRRFTGVLTTPQTQSCNDLFIAATAASSAPGSLNRRESRVWDNFDVRR